jgi:hypothetical protein
MPKPTSGRDDQMSQSWRSNRGKEAENALTKQVGAGDLKQALQRMELSAGRLGLRFLHLNLLGGLLHQCIDFFGPSLRVLPSGLSLELQLGDLCRMLFLQHLQAVRVP